MKRFLIALLAILMVFTGCSPDTPSDGEVRFLISPAARGIEGISMDTAYYTIEGTGPNGTSYTSGKINVSDMNTVTARLRVGDWRFVAEAYNASNQVIGGSNTEYITVYPDKTSSCTFVVKEYVGVGKLDVSIGTASANPGVTFDLSIDLLSADGRYSQNFKLEDADGDGVYTGSFSIPNGTYLVQFKNHGNPSDVATVRIVKGHTTSITTDYVSNGSGDGGFTIDNAIKPSSNVILNLESTSYYVNEILKADVAVEGEVGLPEKVIWYVDNERLEQPATATLNIELSSLNLDTGIPHVLSVVVYDGNDVWSNEKSFVVFPVEHVVLFPETVTTDYQTGSAYEHSYDTLAASITSPVDNFDVEWILDGAVVGYGNTVTVTDFGNHVGECNLSINLKQVGRVKNYPVGTVAIDPSITVIPESDFYNVNNSIYVKVKLNPVNAVFDGQVSLEYVCGSSHINCDVSVGDSMYVGSAVTPGTYDLNISYSIDGKMRKHTLPGNLVIGNYDYVLQGDRTVKENQYASYRISGTDVYQKNIIWYLDDMAITPGRWSYNEYLDIQSVPWSVGKHTLYATVDGSRTNTMNIEVLPVSAEKYYYFDFHSEYDKDTKTLALFMNADNDITTWRTEWNVDGQSAESIDQGKVVFNDIVDPENALVKYIVHYQMDGIEKTYSGSDFAVQESSNGHIAFNRAFYTDKNNIMMDVTLPKRAWQDFGTLSVRLNGNEIMLDDFTHNGTYLLPAYYIQEGKNEITIYGGEYGYYYGSGSFEYSLTGFSAMPAEKVYQNIVLSDNGSIAEAHLYTLVLDASGEQYVLYDVGVDDYVDEQGNWNGAVMETTKGQVVANSDSTISINGVKYTDSGSKLTSVDGTEFTLLNGAPSELGSNGNWKLSEIRPDSNVLNALVVRHLEPMYEGNGFLSDYMKVLDFKSGEGAGVNLQIRLDNGLAKAYLDVDIDATGFDDKIKLADGIVAHGRGSTSYTVHEDGLIEVPGFGGVPIYIQTSADGSVILVHYVYKGNGNDYESIVVPLVRESAIVDSARDTGKYLSENHTVNFRRMLEDATRATDILNDDAGLYSLGRLDVHNVDMTGAWTVSSDGEFNGNDFYFGFNRMVIDDGVNDFKVLSAVSSDTFESGYPEFMSYVFDSFELRGGKIYASLSINQTGMPSRSVDLVLTRKNIRYSSYIAVMAECSKDRCLKNETAEVRTDGNIYYVDNSWLGGVEVFKYSLGDKSVNIMVDANRISEERLDWASCWLGLTLPFDPVTNSIILVDGTSGIHI